MKKLSVAVAALCLCAIFAMAAPKDDSWNGWISDSKCGAKGANAAHAACAQKCVGAGEKPVFVSDKDQKVVAITNPDAVKDHLGHHVKVSGKMTDGGITVDKVTMLAQSGGQGEGMNDMKH